MSYHLVTVFNMTDAQRAFVMRELAMDRFGCLGIEEYSIDEPAVDALLGVRSYSGGDLPLEVLSEVDEFMHSTAFHYKFYFSEAELTQAQAFLNLIKGRFLCEAQLETLQDEDWNAEWKKHYEPIYVEGGLVILPEWVSSDGVKAKWHIKINPGMGFGTGSHETTFLCLKNFLRIRSNLPTEGSILDYGSGSGILGLAAIIVNPNFLADMVDIDLEAHRNCEQNMVLNQVDADKIKLLLLENRPSRQYPLVFANILQNIILEEKDYLISRTEIDGFLVLSGLLKSQIEETLSQYLISNQVVLENKEIKGDWGCLVLRRKV